MMLQDARAEQAQKTRYAGSLLNESYKPRPTLRIEAGATGYVVYSDGGYGSTVHGCSTWGEVMQIVASFPTIELLGEARD